MNRIRRRPRRDGLPARFIREVPATAGVVVGHQVAQPVATTRASRRHALTAHRLLPCTVQLCIHCRQSPAGFWVSRRGGQTVRRPWCLTCCQELHRDLCEVIPFDR
jgi:hypothetical protein